MSADLTAAAVLAAHERETTTDARLIGRTYTHDRTVFVVDCTCGAEFEVEVLDTDACELDALRRGCAVHQIEAMLAAGVVVVRKPDPASPTPALIEAAYIAQDDLSTPPEEWAIKAAAEVIGSYIDARNHDVVHVLGHAAAVAAAETSRQR